MEDLGKVHKSECDHVFRKELYGNRVMRKYTKRQRSTLYGEDKHATLERGINLVRQLEVRRTECKEVGQYKR